MSVILFLIILLVLIIGHELGHFLVAKRVGMKVLEFGVGFPPKLWGKKFGETEYTVNAVPFGGFVRIFGENEEEMGQEQAFNRHSKRSQAAVLFAGPFANIVLAFLAFWIAFAVGVPAVITDSTDAANLQGARVVIASVLPGSPAEEAGIARGAEVVAIRVGEVTTPVEKPEDIAAVVSVSQGAISIVLQEGTEQREVAVTPQAGLITEEPERLGVGVASVLVGTKVLSPLAALSEAFTQTVTGLWAVAVGLATLIGNALTFSASLADVSGPVGIASLVGEAATFGAGQVLILAAIISLNLAVLNLLPFPALDGGRLAMLGYEAVRGIAIRQKTVAVINTVGFVLLIALMLVVTYNDIVKLVT